MRILLFLLLPFLGIANTPISCGPETNKSIGAVVQSVKDGDWHTGSTWSNGRVPAETDDVTFSHNITATKNIVIRGSLTASRGKISFLNINEARFVGSGMDVLASDVGLWVVGSGKLNLTGQAKTSWTNTSGTVNKGATSIFVNDAKGWLVGDEIMVATTDKPTPYIDWNDATNSPIDPMIDKFERRIITGINGNIISFKEPLKYDHLTVTSTLAKKTWYPEVENLTRSIVIEGTRTGRSHIFIMSNRAQTVKYVEGRWLGPRHPGRRSGNLVNGRYGLHFHHCQEGSTGSIVEGNAFHDIGNRVYVPHESDGITFRYNVAHDVMEQPQWWDFQTQSHNILYDGNIQSLRRYNGVNAGSVTGNELNQGDDNIMRNNVAIYVHHGDPHQQGAYSWNTNSVGVWTFEDNLSHSNITGLFVWQNDNALHGIDRYTSYNDELATHHGAYINEYNYRNCIAVNSIVSFEATQGNSNPMFLNYLIDGQGKLPYLVRVLSSPVPAGQPNIFINPVFGGYTQAAILINTELFQGEQGKKIVEVVNPTAPNDNIFAFGAKSIYGSLGRVQRNNTAYEISQSGRRTISPFLPNRYDAGVGLSAKYYNGANFNTLAFERQDMMIKFQQWSVDPGASPDGVHHLIKPGGPFSIVWEGFYIPQVSGQTTFAFESYGGVRLWVDGRQLLNRWQENDDRVKFDASTIALEAGKRYKVRVEHFNTSGNRGIQWYTKTGSTYYNVPVSQLFPKDSSEPPVQANRPPVADAGADITTYDTLLVVRGMATDPDNNLASVKWSGSRLELMQDLSDAAHVRVKAKPGKYTLTLTATDQGGLTATDQMVLLVQAKPDTTNPCLVFDPVFYLKRWPDVAKNWRGTPLSHYEQYGRKEGRVINPACDGGYKSVVVSDTCLDGTILRVEAGKYTGVSQATADAQAQQDINRQKAACAKPWFQAPYLDKILYIFGTPESPIIRIK